MAVLHPEKPFGDEPNSELRVRRAFRTLGDEWHIFHRVRWQSVRGGRQGDGEADFVLLHPGHGVIVVEVKGGRIELVDGAWYTVDRHDERHSIKDPFQQAVDSKYALLAFLRPLLGVGRTPRLCHLVVFPDAAPETIGLHPKPITWGALELANIESSLKTLLVHWEQLNSSALTEAQMEQITSRLAPTLTISRTLRVDLTTSEAELLMLTKRQVELLSNLRRVRRCVATGTAGTGKTILAVEKARQLAGDGAKVLFLCFNTPLSEYLRGLLPPSVTVSTFHSWILSLARRLGVPLRANSPDPLAGKTTELERALELLPKERFDAVLVDEAQDFSATWLQFLDRSVLHPGGFFYVFADPHQQLYGRNYAEPPDCFPFELTQNCRNTVQIASLVATTLGDPLPERGPEGAEVSFVEAAGDELGVVQSVVDDLLVREQIAAMDVVVLCRTRGHVESLLRRTTSTALFVDAPTKVGVFVETIHRFKGLEAPVVVLVPGGATDDTARALHYVGTSRARTFLIVVAPRPVVKKLKRHKLPKR